MNAKLCIPALVLLIALPMAAQNKKAATTATTTNPGSVPCPAEGQTLNPIPEITTNGQGVTKGTLYTVNEQVRMGTTVAGATTPGPCYPQWVRAYRKDPPSSWNPPSSQITNPTPGPVIRARVGDMIELTFINNIDANKFPGVDDGKCDETSVYPGTGTNADSYPDCFAGSVYTNVHYHGTHTNPNTTGDNVFLYVSPSPRKTDGTNTPQITASDVQPTFDAYFTQCEGELKNVPGPKIWPLYWSEINSNLQTLLLNNVQTYGPTGWYQNDVNAIAKGLWPQYYAAAYPYCYKLPVYTQTVWPPVAQAQTQATHMHGVGSAEVPEAENPQRPLIMGQSPGTHWYHAHKHGSTTINVSNGMTGVFIIEGQYDDDINAFYGANWTRSQPTMVINQLSSIPALVSGQKGAGPGVEFSVNGQKRPVINMSGNQVMMWRIANTSSRAGAEFLAPTALQWMQLAQDGVQFNNVNYQASKNISFTVAAGNRVDLLVKAPAYVSGGKNTYDVLVYNTVDPSDRPPQNLKAGVLKPLVLMRVVVGPNLSTPMSFMPQAPTFPAFLADITPGEVTGTQTITFASTSLSNGFPAQHTINNLKFDGNTGPSVTLNQVQEWKIVNATYPPSTGNQISHPYHIHINPFQIFEIFEPSSAVLSSTQGAGTVTTTAGSTTVTGTGTTFTSTFQINDPIWITGEPAGFVVSIQSDTQLTSNVKAVGNTNVKYTASVPLYTINNTNMRTGQCYLNPADNTTWHPCSPTVPQTNAIWWDVFPIPSGMNFYNSAGTVYQIPGYFKMRSRFVDYFGEYVEHCHILAHEDRGMMNVVHVNPLQSTYAHH